MHSDALSARHFTTSAIYIVKQLGPRAADRNMSAEVTEQTVPMLALWALLRWERKLGLVALERVGVDAGALARDVDRVLISACAEFRRANGPPREATPLAPLLDAAEHEALGLGHSWVGTEHLVLAVIRLADARLGEVLDRHQVTYDGIRQALSDILRS